MKIEMNQDLNYGGYELYFVGKRYVGAGRIVSGVQYIFRFENGYGASVIKYNISDFNMKFVNTLPNHMRGFELAVIKFDEEDSFDLVYDTPITNDVITNLENEEVLDILEKIKGL
jgi:hypothetical protein